MNSESHISMILWLPLVGFATVVAFMIGAVVWRYRARIFPPPGYRFVYWIGAIVLVLFMVAAVPFGLHMGQQLAIIGFAGWDDYANGLRVVNKHGLLSDGRFLNGFWSAFSGAFAWCLILIPIVVGVGWHHHFNPEFVPTNDEISPSDVVQ